MSISDIINKNDELIKKLELLQKRNEMEMVLYSHVQNSTSFNLRKAQLISTNLKELQASNEMNAKRKAEELAAIKIQRFVRILYFLTIN